MNIPIIDYFFKLWHSELPHYETLDEYMDYILPKIAPYSEDFYEEEYYTEKAWREVRDDAMLKVRLHIFKKEETPHQITDESSKNGRDYMRVTDGDVEKGNWTWLEPKNSNLITLKVGPDYELFEKGFINNDFMILRKHGDGWLMGERKYFVLGRESYIKRFEWLDVVQLIYNIYRFRIQFIFMVLLAAFIIFIVLFFSIY